MIIFMLLPIIGISYVCWHVWTLLPVSNVWRTIVVALIVVSFLLLFLDITGTLDSLPIRLGSVLYNIGTSSVIVLLYAVMVFLLLDLGRLVHLVPRSWLYGNWITAACVFGFLSALMVYGHLNYLHKVRVPLTLTTAKPLPKDYKVVMLSDLHLGYHNTRATLAKWVDMINAEEPDLILIAGDIIDISVRPLIQEDIAAEFRRLSAPVYACLGNHEYYSGEQQAQQFYRDAGIHLLSDSAVVIDSALVIIGRDDLTNRRRKPLNDIIQHLSPNTNQTPSLGEGRGGFFSILLDHQPHHLEKAEQAGIDFQLSGHTHRGQVWPLSWITDVLYECSWGDHQRGNTRYYVSSGIGIWGGMFRIGTQSEYVVAIIKH